MLKLIFAGSHQQYLDYLQQTGESRQQSMFVESVRDLYSSRGCAFVRYGTWFQRKDRGVVEAQARLREFPVFDHHPGKVRRFR